MIDKPEITSYCRMLDAQLQGDGVRPEEVEKRVSLLQPLETAVSDLTVPPNTFDSPAGRIAESLWYKSHPQDADLERLFSLLADDSAMVRLSAAEALARVLEASRSRPDTQALPSRAKQVLRRLKAQEASPVILYQIDRILEYIDKTIRPRRDLQSRIHINPYIAGLPVYGDRFFGRRDVLGKIEKSFMHMGSKGVVLHGARRTGKTSVLCKIRDGALGSKFVGIYVDLQAFAGATPGRFVQGLMRIMDGVVSERLPEISKDLPPIQDKPPDFFILREYLHELLARLHPTSLVLLLDEFEVIQDIIATSDVSRQFESLLESESNIFTVLTSARKIEQIKQRQVSTLLDTFKYIKLSFMDREDAIDLIRGPAGQSLEFRDDAIEDILELTGGHPFYIQLICQAAFDLVTTKDERIVAANHIAQVVESFLQNPSPHLVLTWNGLTFDQEVTGVAIANLQEQVGTYVSSDEISAWLSREEFPLALRPSEAEHSLVALRDIDWLEKQQQKNAYRLTMDLVRRWILENRSIRDLAEKHIENVLAKVPGFWRQKGAMITDSFIMLALLAMIIIGGLRSRGEVFLLSTCGVALIAYFVLPVLLGHSTLGMRLWQLRLVRASTRPISKKRAIVYGFVQIFRCCTQVALFGATIYIASRSLNWEDLILSIFVLVPAVLELLDAVMLLYGKRRRGLYEKMTDTILIPAGIAKE